MAFPDDPDAGKPSDIAAPAATGRRKRWQTTVPSRPRARRPSAARFLVDPGVGTSAHCGVTRPRDSFVAELRSLQAGIAKHMGAETCSLSGKDYTAADLVARLQVWLDAEILVEAAQARHAEAVAKSDKLRETEGPFARSVRDAFRLRFGHTLTALADFGIAPKKARRAPTNEEELVRIARNNATRVERKTMGKKQKKAIKGNVTGVVITPVTGGDGSGTKE